MDDWTYGDGYWVAVEEFRVELEELVWDVKGEKYPVDKILDRLDKMINKKRDSGS